MTPPAPAARRLVTILVLPVALAGCAAPDPDPSGAALYARWCAECHGPGLEGGTAAALGPGSAAAGMTDGELATLIGEGDPGRGMPGFNLSAGQIDTLVGHLRTAGSGGTP